MLGTVVTEFASLIPESRREVSDGSVLTSVDPSLRRGE